MLCKEHMPRRSKVIAASGEAQGTKVIPRVGETAIGAPAPPQSLQEPIPAVVVSGVRLPQWTARIMDQWIPIPEALSAELGWIDGTELELLPIMNNQMIVRRKGALSDVTQGVRSTQGQATR